LDQREEKLNVAVQDLKQRQKEMPISERLRATGNKKPTSRTKDNPRRKIDKTGSVGAPVGEIQKMIAEMEIEKRRLEHAHS
jgi:hypothetical protein